MHGPQLLWEAARIMGRPGTSPWQVPANTFTYKPCGNIQESPPSELHPPSELYPAPTADVALFSIDNLSQYSSVCCAGSAPCSSNCWTTSLCPVSAAVWRAVPYNSASASISAPSLNKTRATSGSQIGCCNKSRYAPAKRFDSAKLDCGAVAVRYGSFKRSHHQFALPVVTDARTVV
ncbi:hypothetical protein BDW75DRAFT_163161 [Aspergillus navahoensis]